MSQSLRPRCDILALGAFVSFFGEGEGFDDFCFYQAGSGWELLGIGIADKEVV